MAIAGRRRVPAGFTNVTYRTVGRLVNRLAAGTDCVPPGTAMSAVPAYEDDDFRAIAHVRHRGTTSLIAPVAPLRTVALGAASLRDRLCSAVSGRSRRFYWAIAAVLPKTPR